MQIKGAVRSMQHPLVSAANHLHLLDMASHRDKFHKTFDPAIPPSKIVYTENGLVKVEWKRPQQQLQGNSKNSKRKKRSKTRFRELPDKTYEHLHNLWAIRLDGPDSNYYQSLMAKYRKAKEIKSTITPEKWADEQKRLDETGKKFMKMPRKVMVE